MDGIIHKFGKEERSTCNLKRFS